MNRSRPFQAVRWIVLAWTGLTLAACASHEFDPTMDMSDQSLREVREIVIIAGVYVDHGLNRRVLPERKETQRWMHALLAAEIGQIDPSIVVLDGRNPGLPRDLEINIEGFVERAPPKDGDPSELMGGLMIEIQRPVGLKVDFSVGPGALAPEPFLCRDDRADMRRAVEKAAERLLRVSVVNPMRRARGLEPK